MHKYWSNKNKQMLEDTTSATYREHIDFTSGIIFCHQHLNTKIIENNLFFTKYTLRYYVPMLSRISQVIYK